MQVPAISIGSRIEYVINPASKKFKNKKTGILIDQTDKLLVLNMGKYRETILKNDLISGAVKITSIMKGEETMAQPNKLEIPSIEYLQELFEKAGGNIRRAAQNCEPQVSDVTMGKWLRETGIIPVNNEAPPAEELRSAWEAANRKISVVAKKYHVKSHVAKRWLKDAGIIVETTIGIETIEIEQKAATDNSTGEKAAEIIEINETSDKDLTEAYRLIAELSTYLRTVTETLNRLENQVDTIITDTDELDHAAIKKLVDFCIAPIQGRIEYLEESLIALNGSPEKSNMDTIPESMAGLDVLADLVTLVWYRLIAGKEA